VEPVPVGPPPAGLRDFQQQLAHRLQLAAAARGTLQDGIAALTASYAWLFSLAHAAEVIAVPALTTVPFTQPWYLGLFSHRGELTAAIDLDGLLGAPIPPWRATDRLLLLSSSLPLRCAIRIAHLTGIVDRASLCESERDPQLPAWAPALFADADGVHRAWVDIDALMRDPAFLDISCR
jgi:twitching motility protein PilI